MAEQNPIFDIIGICNYCGKRGIVHFDKDINAEDLSKICNKCECNRTEQITKLDNHIFKIMGEVPYTQTNKKDIIAAFDKEVNMEMAEFNERYRMLKILQNLFKLEI